MQHPVYRLTFQWLNEEKVIQRLVDMVQPSQDEDVSVVRVIWPCLYLNSSSH